MWGSFSERERKTLYSLSAIIVAGAIGGSCLLTEAYRDLRRSEPIIRQPEIRLQVASLRREWREARESLQETSYFPASYLLSHSFSELPNESARMRKAKLLSAIGARESIADLLE